MYVPFALFLNYNSPFPWWAGPLLQIIGFTLLGLTRGTARHYPRFGRTYYVFCAILRPLGILIIAWAWVEISSISSAPSIISNFADERIIFLTLLIMLIVMALFDKFWRGFFLIFVGITLLSTTLSQLLGVFGWVNGWLSIFYFGLFWSLWSVGHLGFRRSFLYSKIDDVLVTTGPYTFHRHPQLLSALIIAFSALYLAEPSGGLNPQLTIFRTMNFFLMAGAVCAITRKEERDLVKQFGENYVNYCTKVPSFVGRRQIKLKPLWEKLGKFSIVAIFLANITTLCMFYAFIYGLEMKRPFLFLRMNMATPIARWVTERDLRYLGYQLQDWFKDNEDFPQSPKASWIRGWQEWDRTSKYSPYPQTLFYCDQVYYGNVSDKTKARWPEKEYLVVKELPFPLICNAEQVEIAQAMDYDGDSFPQVWVLRFSKKPTNEFRNYDVLPAADDSRNHIYSNFKERIKAP